MKLQTTIQPRKDGTVIVRNAKGKEFRFERDQHGDMVCDVDDPALVASLLLSEDFMPVDPADFGTATELVQIQGGDDTDLDEVGHTPEGSPPGEGEDEPDDEGDVDAAPVEGASAQPDAATASGQGAARQSRRRS